MPSDGDAPEPPEGFEPYDSNSRAFGSAEGEIAVRVRLHAGASQFLYTPAARAFLGDPDGIRYFYNDDTEQVAFAPADPENPRAYSVASAGNSTSAQGLLSAIGVDTSDADDSVFLPTTTDADRGWLLADLSPLIERYGGGDAE